MSAPLTFPINYRRYHAVVPIVQDRSDIPLRAQSVSLTERPRSKYARNVRSADHRSRSDKQFFHQRPIQTKPLPKINKVVVKQQKRKTVDKVPCAISVQTLSIPMKYADPNRHSTSKPCIERADYKTKSSNPPKQGDNKRLCSTVGGGKETENKLLLQICEAKQVSDFERILNSNAILCERATGHVWRRTVDHASTASVLPRPRSSYSLHTVSRAYYELFQQHEESLQPLIKQYRQAAADDHKSCPPVSILQENWFENLQDLSEFYEDDEALQQEIVDITDKIVTEEIKAAEEVHPSARNKNFNVNLTDLIGLHVNGEGFSPISTQDGPSPDADKGAEQDAEDKEWLGASMSAHSEFNPIPQENDSVDCLSKNLNSVQIDSDAKVPTITFSNCCDGCARSDNPNNTEVVIHLTVPSIESSDETRPPM